MNKKTLFKYTLKIHQTNLNITINISCTPQSKGYELTYNLAYKSL